MPQNGSVEKLADRIHTIRKVDKNGMNVENTDAEFFFYDDRELVVVYLEKPTNWPPARICQKIEFLRNQYDMAISSDGRFVKKQQFKKATRVYRFNSYSGQRWKLDNNKKLENKKGVWKSDDLWIFKTKDDDLIYIENT